MRLIMAALMALALTWLPVTVEAKGGNPIFGDAQVTALSKEDSQNVVGKGYYADLYGYYGYLYAGWAETMSYYALYYYAAGSAGETNAYYDAYLYASYASTYLYYAYYFSLYNW